jgi:hypothetical protein
MLRAEHQSESMSRRNLKCTRFILGGLFPFWSYFPWR